MMSAGREAGRPSLYPVVHFYAGLAYLAFVVYGSLVPLKFHHRNWEDAWRMFTHIPYLELGIVSRADWIANILLYVPLTFLWSAILARPRRALANVLAPLAVLAAAVALAILIEFVQLYFPQRTVSLNDIIAEAIGSSIGILLWHAAGNRVAGWIDALRHRDDRATAAALSLYLAAYVCFSLFPFDFVVSADELSYRLANNNNSLFLSTASYKSTLRCVAQLLLELLAAVPVGLMLARVRKFSGASIVGTAFLAGALLGLAIEGAQIFLNSGVSQGLSVLTRAAGAALGASIFIHRGALFRQARQMATWSARTRWPAVSVTLVYLAGLAALQNWKGNEWLDGERGLARLPDVNFLPFYYHYFTTETAALISLWFTLVAYAPVGVLVFWITQRGRHRSPLASAFVASMLAAGFECIKLFQSNMHPDPTNALIAAAGAAASHGMMRWLMHGQAYPAYQPTIHDAANAVPLPMPVTSTPGHIKLPDSFRMGLISLSSIGLLTWATYSYPFTGTLIAGSLVYLAILYRWPHAWLALLPLALPVLDMAPWTGRFFFDEFDCLILATIAAAGFNKLPAQKPYRLSLIALVLFSFSVLALCAAALIGAYPFADPDVNSFNNYYSPYNALRLGKGLLWALLLLPLLKKQLNRDPERAGRMLSLGMTLGLAATGIVVLWERIAFTGLFNFIDSYRVTGMFSGMHTGGANIEAYLVMSLPFAAWWSLMARSWSNRLFGAAVFMLGSYAMAVTYARGGYVTLAIAVAVLVAFLLARKSVPIKQSRPLASAILLVLLAGSGWLFMQGKFIQNRFSTTQRDLGVRSTLWHDALQMMDDKESTSLFGMGLGRYPETYFWRNTEGVRPAAYSFKTEDDNTFLVLGAGSPLYFEQIVDVHAHHRYRLSFYARSDFPTARLIMPLCEKWMLYSATCVMQSVQIGDTGGRWLPFAVTFDAGKLADRPWYAYRPVKLSLSNPVIGTVVAIDGISFISDEGQEILKNGDFSDAMDHWYFSTDNHHPWHLENLWLQLYFEQGAFGLCVFSLLAIYLFVMLARRCREAGFPAPALAGALAGFLSLGVVDSVFDFPRMSMLFYLFAAWIALQPRPHAKPF